MAGKQIRYVNVVPNVRIKKELPSDDDEESVQCRVCSKTFASDVALRNHARLEHVQAFATGDPSSWTEPQPKTPKKEPVDPTERIQQKTKALISSMAPASLMSLASEDVSYIIIKNDEELGRWESSKVRKRKREGNEREVKVTIARKEEKKEVQPITGPFECLQPSTLVADGTCHQIFFSCCEYSVHFRDEHTRRRKGLRCQVCEKPLIGADGGLEPLAPYTCEVCGAGFQDNKELSDHMATDHVKLKPYECKVCHKRFTQQGGVQQHMRMHTGDRPFPCTFCEKAFTQKSGLDQHLRIHTKVKPYRCVVCSKTFCQSVHLKQHMRTHTNVSPFQCGICSKRFTQKSGLEQHSRIHSKEKPYSCDVCAKSFIQTSHLRQHMKTHELSGTTCQFCFERFKQSSHLNYHLKNHNTAGMTDEQRVQYKKLIAQITSTTEPRNEKKFMCVLGKDNDVQLVEVEEDQDQDQGEGQEMEEEIEETTEEEVPMDDTEVVGEDDEGRYILSDVGSEVWSVKLAADSEQ